MWRPDELCRQEADRKSLPSQPSPQWRREVVRSGELAGTGQEGAALSPVVAGPDTGSYSSAGGPPGQTPGAPSPSAAPRSRPPAQPSPPPVCLSPVDRYGEGNQQGVGRGKIKVGEMGRKGRQSKGPVLETSSVFLEVDVPTLA